MDCMLWGKVSCSKRGCQSSFQGFGLSQCVSGGLKLMLGRLAERRVNFVGKLFVLLSSHLYSLIVNEKNFN